MCVYFKICFLIQISSRTPRVANDQNMGPIDGVIEITNHRSGNSTIGLHNFACRSAVSFGGQFSQITGLIMKPQKEPTKRRPVLLARSYAWAEHCVSSAVQIPFPRRGASALCRRSGGGGRGGSRWCRGAEPIAPLP